ncbi:MAG: UxaA family hydrolase [Pirellulales bacterium]
MQQSSNKVTGSAPRPRALRLHADDNVAVALANIEPGRIEILGSGDGALVTAQEPISQGHKLALRPIAEREALLKYGVAIGVATSPIAAGAWVHTHNCRSGLDERSHTLDPHSGAPTDTRYV